MASASGWLPLDPNQSRVVPAGAAEATSAGAAGGVLDGAAAKAGHDVIAKPTSAQRKVLVIANSKWKKFRG
jgi:hypothetical protein